MKLRLYCIPYAGGSATVFYKFRSYIDKNIEIYPIELAGRGRRIKEPLYLNIDDAADDVYRSIKNSLDGNAFAIFGHSLGGLLAYITAVRLQHEDIIPKKLFISASRAPHCLCRARPLHVLPDEQFKNEILVMGGTDKSVFDNPELSKFFLKVLKADFAIIENCGYSGAAEHVKADMSVFCGNDDRIPQNEIVAWQDYADGSFSSHLFSGDHFFINSKPQEVCRAINSELCDSL